MPLRRSDASREQISAAAVGAIGGAGELAPPQVPGLLQAQAAAAAELRGWRSQPYGTAPV